MTTTLAYDGIPQNFIATNENNVNAEVIELNEIVTDLMGKRLLL